MAVLKEGKLRGPVAARPLFDKILALPRIRTWVWRGNAVSDVGDKGGEDKVERDDKLPEN